MVLMREEGERERKKTAVGYWIGSFVVGDV